MEGVYSYFFRQILPVVPGANRSEVFESCLKRSTLWKFFERFELTENVRLSSCSEEAAAHYDRWLLDVGNGKAPNNKTVVLPWDRVHLVRRETRHSDILSCIHWVYGNLEVKLQFRFEFISNWLNS